MTPQARFLAAPIVALALAGFCRRGARGRRRAWAMSDTTRDGVKMTSTLTLQQALKGRR